MVNVEIRKERTSMKLLEKVLDDKNLFLAYKQVYKNKGASGVDGVIVDQLPGYVLKHVKSLRTSRQIDCRVL